MNKSTLLVSFFVLGLVLPGAASAAPACGETVGGPGQTVVLDGDVGPCTGSALVVADGTAVLDLGGFTVSCTDNTVFTNRGIDGWTEGLLLRNGTLSGCFRGVDGDNGDGLTAENIVAENNSTGLEVTHCLRSVGRNNLETGIHMSFGTGDGCSAIDNGIVGLSVQGSRLRNSTAIGTGGNGVVVQADGSLSNVTAIGNSGHGIWIFNGEKTKVSGCRAIGNGGAGIQVFQFVDSARLSKNQAHGNTSHGIELQGKASVVGNVSSANSGDGIHAAAGATGAKIIKNTARNNAGDDLFTATAGCTGTAWKKNSFTSANDACIE